MKIDKRPETIPDGYVLRTITKPPPNAEVIKVLPDNIGVTKSGKRVRLLVEYYLELDNGNASI